MALGTLTWKTNRALDQTSVPASRSPYWIVAAVAWSETTGVLGYELKGLAVVDFE